ncbi:CBF-domain-containing protein, partial [Nadsonia fulvescens var. elongata DSM 6958]
EAKKSEPKKSEPKKSETKKAEKKKPAASATVPDVSEDEFESLGGSKDDLDLIKDINDYNSDASEMEFETTGGNDESLADDISAFMGSIGLSKTVEKVLKKKVENTEPEKTKDSETTEKLEAAAPIKEKKKSKQQLKKERKEEEKLKKVAENEKKQLEEQKVAQSKKANLKEAVAEQTKAVTGKLKVTPRNDWYNHTEDLPSEVAEGKFLPDALIERLHNKAKNLLQLDNEIYKQENNTSSSQRQFLSQILTSGTLNDKISAFTLLIQESPLHNMKSFESILGLCKKKSRTSSVQGISALKDLFISGVLPNRKLKWFKNQPLANDTPNSWLIIWAFEDWLKQFYFQLLQIIEVLTHDSVVFVKTNVVAHITDLLKAKPEQEVNLLRLVVNKLGDSDKKVASKVSYLVLQLQMAHPAMKKVIIDAISEVIFRSGVDYHARYYSIITLNQTIIAHREKDVANALVNIYFNLFERLLSEDKNIRKMALLEKEKPKKKARWKTAKGKKGGEKQQQKADDVVKEESHAKLISAILTGLNRAFPFSDLPDDVFSSHMDSLFRITHSSNFGTSVQALMLIFQVSQSKQTLSDRFYRTLYESLLDPRLISSSKQSLYLNLLFKALKEDFNVNRVRAFVKRIIQVSISWINIGSVAGMVYLLSELFTVKPVLRTILAVNGEYDSDDEEEFKDAADSDDEDEKNVKESMLDKTSKKKDVYSGYKRDPIFANADKTALWEFLPLLNHFHPTVTSFADKLFACEPSGAKPDLALHSLGHFLDRFVYRNAKTKNILRGNSIMQPLAGGDDRGILIGTKSARVSEKPINSADWLNKKPEDIEVDERFFHQYFLAKGQEKKKSRTKQKDIDDEEIDDSDVGEEEIWQALVRSNPDGNPEDDDDDIDIDDDDM